MTKVWNFLGQIIGYGIVALLLFGFLQGLMKEREQEAGCPNTGVSIYDNC